VAILGGTVAAPILGGTVAAKTVDHHGPSDRKPSPDAQKA
jgi:hypothetical protein